MWNETMSGEGTGVREDKKEKNPVGGRGYFKNELRLSRETFFSGIHRNDCFFLTLASGD